MKIKKTLMRIIHETVPKGHVITKVCYTIYKTKLIKQSIIVQLPTGIKKI